MTDKVSRRQSVTYGNHAVSDDHLCTNIKTAYVPNAGKGLSGFGGLLSEGCFGGLLFANRLVTLLHGAALEALFAFPF